MNGDSAGALDDAVAGWMSRWVERTSEPTVFDDAVTYLDDVIVAELPELAADPELRRDLEASTRAHLRALLATLGSAGAELPPEAYGLARTLARRGFGVEMLLRLYRVALRATQRYLCDAVEQSPDDPALKSDVLVRMWAAASEWLDSAVDLLGPSILEERRRLLGAGAARRGEVVRALLHGEPMDTTTASQVLRYPLFRVHTALALWTEDESEDAARMPEIADALAAILGADEPLTVPSGEHGLWAWCATDHVPDLELLSTSRALHGAAGVHVAAGMSAVGIAGFCRSHRQAMAAQRLAIIARRTRQVTRYAEVELVTMLSADVDTMRDFVCRELGSLADDNPATERLRETALAVLTSGIAGAAKAIPVHKNTVRYRLKQIEALLEHPIDQRRAQVELALRCVAEFGARSFD